MTDDDGRGAREREAKGGIGVGVAKNGRQGDRCRERRHFEPKQRRTPWGEGGRAGGRDGARRNSIKIGEICIVPRNVEERRDVVECPRGDGNPSTKKRTNCEREEKGIGGMRIGGGGRVPVTVKEGDAV